MRKRWLIVFLAAIPSLAILAAACGGDSTPAVSDSDDSGPTAADDSTGGDEPTSSGFVAPNTFLTLEGQRYQLGDVFQADLISSDQFTEIGAASAADIDFEGELTVFLRSGADAAVYTFSPAVDVDGAEEDVPALWLRWELVVDAPGEEPSGDEPTFGFVAPNVFMTVDGQRYQLRDVLQANLISDDFTEIGAASEANIDFDGELTVFRREGDDAVVYTYSPAEDADGEKFDLPALWLRWEPVE